MKLLQSFSFFYADLYVPVGVVIVIACCAVQPSPLPPTRATCWEACAGLPCPSRWRPPWAWLPAQ